MAFETETGSDFRTPPLLVYVALLPAGFVSTGLLSSGASNYELAAGLLSCVRWGTTMALAATVGAIALSEGRAGASRVYRAFTRLPNSKAGAILFLIPILIALPNLIGYGLPNFNGSLVASALVAVSWAGILNLYVVPRHAAANANEAAGSVHAAFWLSLLLGNGLVGVVFFPILGSLFGRAGDVPEILWFGSSHSLFRQLFSRVRRLVLQSPLVTVGPDLVLRETSAAAAR